MNTTAAVIFGIVALMCMLTAILLPFWSRGQERAEARSHGQRLQVSVTEIYKLKRNMYRVKIHWVDSSTHESCTIVTDEEFGSCPFTKGDQIFVWLAANRLSAFIEKNQNPELQ